MAGTTTNPLRNLIIPLAIAGFALATPASTPIPVDFEELANRAEFVVVGRVTAQNAKFNDEGTAILTHTRIEVDRFLAGEAPATFEIAEYGGRVDDRVMFATGQVVYEQGERVLLFVCRDALALLRTCGARQGRMRVETAADGSMKAEGRMAGEFVAASVQTLEARIQLARERSR